ncbi:hypothetical protein [Rhodococcus koreensis]|uniref:hypothetical protein n=1 Tax=Rhodococcus koreensis TaxID=99653 RepID=UPI0036DB15E8
MNTVIDKFFTTPMSWLLGVPVVLLDRMLVPGLPELRRYAAPPKSGPQGPSVHIWRTIGSGRDTRALEILTGERVRK